MRRPPFLTTALLSGTWCLGSALVVPSLAEGDVSPWLRLWGRLHPAIVHFPIALLVCAGLLELLRSRKRFPERSQAVTPLLALGALSAVAAASMGWFNAELEGHGRSVEKLVFYHRWTGVATAVLSCLTLVCGLLHRGGANWRLRGYRWGLVATVATVAWGSHLGGSLVYGEGYLTEVFEQPHSGGPSDPGGEPPPDGGGASAGATTVSYEQDIRPIFRENCIDCHGKRRSRGRLRLDVMEATFERAPEFWAIRPGDPDGSELVRRIELPAEDPEAMPSEGEPLSSEEIDLIRTWIAEGAKWQGGSPASVSTSEAKAPIEERGDPPIEPVRDGSTPSADEALGRLAEAGVLASRLAQDTEEVEVNFSLRAGVTDADLGLLAGLEETLVSLNLSRSGVTDEGLAVLAPYKRLRKLYLASTSVGSSGLAHLAHLKELEYLNVFDTQVGDAGLVHLRALPNLRKVFLWQTEVTEAGTASLAEAMPELQIVLD